MNDSSGTWFHCSRCGSLFRASSEPENRGPCTECGEDPVPPAEAVEPARVRVRRKSRRPKPPVTGRKRRRGSRKQARALRKFVVIWATVLLALGAWLKFSRGEKSPSITGPETAELTGQALADWRLIQAQLNHCGTRLHEFLAATDISGRSPHVLDPDRVVPEMARVAQYDPIFSSTETISPEFYQVIHTPVGRAIETIWKQGDDKRVEAIFFEEDGTWKIDWHAFARIGSEPWAPFLLGHEDGEGTFRLLARERIGADGRDPEHLGLVLYSQRPGHPDEIVSPSPEIRVTRASIIGQEIQKAFDARSRNLGPYGSEVVKYDPHGMIRLHVRVKRNTEKGRVFEISELLATHWMELPGR